MTVEHIAGANVEGLPMSEAVRAGDFVFLSGLAGLGPDGAIISGGIAAETDRIMLEAKDILQRSGLGLADIVQVKAHLRRAALLNEFNTAYSRYFPQDKPARSVSLTDFVHGGSVELEIVAFGNKVTP